MLWNGLRELPSTNYRIFASVFVEVIFALTVLGCLAFDRKVDVNVVWALGILITGWLGLGVAQFGWQRGTDREYAAVKSAATPPTVTVDSPANAQVNIGAPAVPSAVPSDAPAAAEPPAPPAAPQLLPSGERGAD